MNSTSCKVSLLIIADKKDKVYNEIKNKVVNYIESEADKGIMVSLSKAIKDLYPKQNKIGYFTTVDGLVGRLKRDGIKGYSKRNPRYNG